MLPDAAARSPLCARGDGGDRITEAAVDNQRPMRRLIACCLLGAAFPFMGGCAGIRESAEPQDELACARMLAGGFRAVADERADRFLGKVAADTARCRGGENAMHFRATPYVDWANYWAAGDASSKSPGEAATRSHF